MYPIDNFKANDPDKIEAMRYYLELNKAYLKEVSREEYDVFAEFLKGEGKDIMLKIAEVKTDKELYSQLAKLEKALPYGKSLSKLKTFEQKVAEMHKILAKLFVRNDVVLSPKQVYQNQKQMAAQYDGLMEEIKSYRDALLSYRELKEKISNQSMIKHIFANKMQQMDKGSVEDAIKNAMQQKHMDVKQKRASVLKNIREYNVKELAYVMEQEMLAAQK